jgi:AcrR family transcriptional regulator
VRDLRRGEGRDALVRATIQVVARDGLRKMTTRAVAEEAGTAHGLVRHHFGNVTALLLAAMEYSVEQSLAATRELVGLDTVAHAIVEDIRRDPELYAFQYELLLEARRDGAFRDVARNFYARYRATVAQTLRLNRIEPAEDYADLVFAAFDGAAFAHLVLGEDRNYEEIVHRMLSMVAAMAGGEIAGGRAG